MLTQRMNHKPGDVTEERLSRALEVLSAIVLEHGDKHAHLHALIEGQLQDLRARQPQPDFAPVYAEAV